MWLRSHGVACHAWSVDFFVSIVNSLGSYICVNDNTLTGYNMDIARILIRVPRDFYLNKHIFVLIDDEAFVLSLRVDSYGPVYIAHKKGNPVSNISSSSSSKDSWPILENSSFRVKDSHGTRDSSSKDNNPKGRGSIEKKKVW